MTESGRVSRIAEVPLEELTGDERLIAEMLRGLPLVQAAQRAGLPERTARRHLENPELRARLDEGRVEVMRGLAAMLAGGAELGYATLRELAENEETADAVRRNAARDLIEYADSLGTARDIERRLEALEAERELRRRVA
jgi:hypothetical protein